MNASQAGYDSNRLPWLNDTAEPAVKINRKASPVRYFLGGVAAAFLIAGAAYWIGLRSIADEAQSSSEASISLPGPIYSHPEEMPAEQSSKFAEETSQPRIVLVPQTAPVVIRQTVPVPMPLERDESSTAKSDAVAATPDGATYGQMAEQTASDSTVQGQAPVQPQVQPAPTRAAPLRLWPADVSEGASGRAVRIGTYASRLQAKRAWAKLVRVYPGMRRLKAVVAPAPSVRNGKTYYRLQFGTTSHAHSAVLCQRMRIVGQSCVVVGAPQSGGAAAS